MNARIGIGAALTLAVHTAAAVADPVETRRAWTETYPVASPRPTLDIRNVWGDVVVRPGAANAITVAVEERRSAASRADYDRALDILALDVEAGRNGVSLQVGDRDGVWYRDDHCRECRAEFCFEVTVPPGTTLRASTVTDGAVDISGIAGPVHASNVNGPVRLTLAAPPRADVVLETVNGDIHLHLPAEAGMDLALDLFNGRVTSEFPVEPLTLPAHVEQDEEDGRHRYRIDQPAGIRVAGGGPTVTVTSINGDVRILKTQ